MFIRQVTRTNGSTAKRYHTLHLVESVRTERGPRQRVVLDLGSLQIPREQYKALANAIEMKLLGQESYLQEPTPFGEVVETAVRKIISKGYRASHPPTAAEPTPSDAECASRTSNSTSSDSDDFEPVQLGSICCEDVRSIGAEWVGHQMYERLGFAHFFREQGLNPQACQMIESLIVGRLVAPRSEHATWEWLSTNSALGELIGLNNHGSLASLYRATDKIWEHHVAIEEHLHHRERVLFDLPETLFLLDLTNVFLEGDAESNPKAQRGHSKEKRSDCKLLSLALVVDEQGFAKCSRVYPGNIHEARTVTSILDDMRQRLQTDLRQMTVVMDRGLATAENLAKMREAGLTYIVAARGRDALDPTQPFTVINPEKGEDQAVTVQRVPTTDQDGDDDVYLRCHSPARQSKEDAIRDQQEGRLLAELVKARNALNAPRGTKRYHKVCERIGRLRERFSRAAPLYDITVHADSTDEKPGPDAMATAITWEKNDHHQARIEDAGTYLLRTNRKDIDDATIWKLYTTLTQVERSFRCLKSDLGLRPCYHQTEERSDAHLFIAVMAYHLLHAIEFTLRKAGDKRSWATIREVLKPHTRLTVSCTTQDEEGRNQQTYIRLCSEPTQAMQEIYNTLNLSHTPLPKLRTDF